MQRKWEHARHLWPMIDNVQFATEVSATYPFLCVTFSRITIPLKSRLYWVSQLCNLKKQYESRITGWRAFKIFRKIPCELINWAPPKSKSCRASPIYTSTLSTTELFAAPLERLSAAHWIAALPVVRRFRLPLLPLLLPIPGSRFVQRCATNDLQRKKKTQRQPLALAKEMKGNEIMGMLSDMCGSFPLLRRSTTRTFPLQCNNVFV